jgi:putative transposase
MLELLRIFLPTLAKLFRKRRDLLVENLLLRYQLQVALRSRPRLHLKTRDRFFWLVVRRLYPDWKRHLILFRPETVLRWPPRLATPPTLALRLRSGPPTIEPRDSRADHHNGEREPPLGHRAYPRRAPQAREGGARSIRRYRRRRHSRPPSQSWRTFLANYAQAIWAADLFVVKTLTFQNLYVIFFIGHGRRELLHFKVTAHPTAAWVWRR